MRGQAGREEDIADVEDQVDGDGGAAHGWEDPGPVAGVAWKDAEEESVYYCGDAGDEHEDCWVDEVEYEAAGYGEDDAAEAAGDVPGDHLDGADAEDVAAARMGVLVRGKRAHG